MRNYQFEFSIAHKRNSNVLSAVKALIFFPQIINIFYFSFDSGAGEIPRGISNVRSYTSPGDTVGRTSRMRQNSPCKGDYLFAHFSFAAGDVISAEAACRQGEMIHWHVLRVECPQLTQFYLLFCISYQSKLFF